MTRITTVKKCPECNTIMLRAVQCEACGWPKGGAKSSPINSCYFFADGNCKGKASNRINDAWLCGWHYENFYEHKHKAGEKIPLHELKFTKRFFDVSNFVGEYQEKNKSANKREACFAFMKKIGCFSKFEEAFPNLARTKNQGRNEN